MASIDTEERENDVAVKLRLKRMGKKKQPTYRIVAADSRSPRDGRFIEFLGTYAPRAEPSLIEVDNAKAVAWLAKGARPSDTVRKILEISGAWAEFTATQTPKAAKAARQESESAKKHAAKGRSAGKGGAKKAGAKKADAPSRVAPAEADEETAPPIDPDAASRADGGEAIAAVDSGDD